MLCLVDSIGDGAYQIFVMMHQPVLGTLNETVPVLFARLEVVI